MAAVCGGFSVSLLIRDQDCAPLVLLGPPLASLGATRP
jgi:hypothetical protein